MSRRRPETPDDYAEQFRRQRDAARAKAAAANIALREHISQHWNDSFKVARAEQAAETARYESAVTRNAALKTRLRAGDAERELAIKLADAHQALSLCASKDTLRARQIARNFITALDAQEEAARARR